MVDRPALVESLRRLALTLGAMPLDWQGPLAYERVDSAWIIKPRHGRSLSARFLVDATGRASVVARRLGARRLAADHQAAVVASLDGDDPGGSPMLVEAVSGGWWYSAQCPRVGLVLAFFTDRDLIDICAARERDGFHALIESSRVTRDRARANGRPLTGRPCAVAAESSALDRVCDEGWIAAGDAALAYDPLSGHGLTFALASGRDAGRAVRACLRGNPVALARYADHIAGSAQAYRLGRAVQYAAEGRWTDNLFWKRRRGSTLADATATT